MAVSRGPLTGHEAQMTDWPAWAWIEEPPPRPAHESVTMTRSPTLSGAARGARTAATLIAAGEAVRKGGGSRYLRRSDGGGSQPDDREQFLVASPATRDNGQRPARVSRKCPRRADSGVGF
jgi:hypothetical protein